MGKFLLLLFITEKPLAPAWPSQSGPPEKKASLVRFCTWIWTLKNNAVLVYFCIPITVCIFIFYSLSSPPCGSKWHYFSSSVNYYFDVIRIDVIRLTTSILSISGILWDVAWFVFRFKKLIRLICFPYVSEMSSQRSIRGYMTLRPANDERFVPFVGLKLYLYNVYSTELHGLYQVSTKLYLVTKINC